MLKADKREFVRSMVKDLRISCLKNHTARPWTLDIRVEPGFTIICTFGSSKLGETLESPCGRYRTYLSLAAEYAPDYAPEHAPEQISHGMARKAPLLTTSRGALI